MNISTTTVDGTVTSSSSPELLWLAAEAAAANLAAVRAHPWQAGSDLYVAEDEFATAKAVFLNAENKDETSLDAWYLNNLATQQHDRCGACK